MKFGWDVDKCWGSVAKLFANVENYVENVYEVVCMSISLNKTLISFSRGLFSLSSMLRIMWRK